MPPINNDPVYVISVAARIVGLHAQTLRAYEREGLVQPSRSSGGVRMYSDRDIDRLRTIRRFVEELGVNRAGVDIILRLSDRLTDLQQEIGRLKEELQRERDRNLPVPQPFRRT